MVFAKYFNPYVENRKPSVCGLWIESGVLHDFGKAKVEKEDPRRRWGEGPWGKHMGSGEVEVHWH